MIDPNPGSVTDPDLTKRYDCFTKPSVGGDINHDMRDTRETTYHRLAGLMEDSFLAADNVHVNYTTKSNTIFPGMKL